MITQARSPAALWRQERVSKATLNVVYAYLTPDCLSIQWNMMAAVDMIGEDVGCFDRAELRRERRGERASSVSATIPALLLLLGFE